MRPQAQTPPLQVDRPSLNRFLIWAVAGGIAVFLIPLLAGAPFEPFILINVYVVLLGGAIWTTRRSGPGGVRRLFSGVFRWRIGVANWAFVAGALPAATIAVAALSGTYTAPPDGWASAIGNYLFLTFVFGALIVNVFEETVWNGLVQRNLTRRYGLLKGAALTALPFAAFHIPLSFAGDPATTEIIVVTAVLIVGAPIMRYLMGRTDHATGGSLLAVGVLHASYNASGQLGVTDSEWQYAVGLVVVAAIVLAIDAIRARSRGHALYADTAAIGSQELAHA